MNAQDKYPNNKDRNKDSVLNEPIYRDINTNTDNCIKIPVNKDRSKDPLNYKYDYMSLRNILRIEMDKPITIKQSKVVGDALVDLYQAMYFEDL